MPCLLNKAPPTPLVVKWILDLPSHRGPQAPVPVHTALAQSARSPQDREHDWALGQLLEQIKGEPSAQRPFQELLSPQ